MATYDAVTVVSCGSAISSVTFGNTVTETTLYSEVLPAGVVNDTGSNIHLRMNGVASGSAVPPILTLRSYYGTTTLTECVISAPANQTDVGWVAQFDITTRSPSLVMAQSWCMYPSVPQGDHSGNTLTVAPVTSDTITFSVKGQYASATAGNTITMTNAIIYADGLI